MAIYSHTSVRLTIHCMRSASKVRFSKKRAATILFVVTVVALFNGPHVGRGEGEAGSYVDLSL